MLNRISFIGHLGRDPEVRYLPNGNAVASFSVASSEKWKDKQTGEQMEATEWLRCSAFERLAEICGEYLKKGSLVYVEGALKTRKYTDKDGTEKYATECRVREMKMLGGKDGEKPAERPAQKPAASSAQNAYAAAKAGRPVPQQSTGFDDMPDDITF